MNGPRIIASVLIVATWVSAILMLMSGNVGCQVLAWVFIAAKGVSLGLTLLAMIRNRRLAWHLFGCRYNFDNRKHHGLTQAVTRFTWELPQLFLGYAIAQTRVLIGDVDRVDTLGGVTYVTCCHRHEHSYTGMSLGCFVQMWMPVEIKTDFENYARHYAGRMLLHEYGHTFDSQLWGWLYLPLVGLPSLVSQGLELAGLFHHHHEDLYAERWANRHADKYFG